MPQVYSLIKLFYQGTTIHTISFMVIGGFLYNSDARNAALSRSSPQSQMLIYVFLGMSSVINK